MARKAANEIKIPAELDKDLLLRVGGYIATKGFAPLTELQKEFGAQQITTAITLLHKNWRFLREAREKWGEKGEEVLGYRRSDVRFSKSQLKKLPPVVGEILDMFGTQQRKYSDWKPIAVKCRWTNYTLGGFPAKDEDGSDICRFLHVGNTVKIPAYCLRAMTRQALQVINKESSIAFHITYEVVTVPIPKEGLEIIQTGVVPSTPSSMVGGRGIRRLEALPPGTEFIIRAQIPTSALPPEDYLLMLKEAGKKVRLSQARSAGFGDFEVIGVLDQ